MFQACASVRKTARIVHLTADPIDNALQNLSLSAQQFHSGPLCGITAAEVVAGSGHLHVIHQGLVEVLHEPHPVLRIVEPTVLLYPRPLAHRFRVDSAQESQFSCATVTFSNSSENPLVRVLPPVVALPLSQLSGAQATLELLFIAARDFGGGRQATLDRLFEVLLIRMLRALIDNGQIAQGVVRGMAHPQLGTVLMTLHRDLARRWTLDALAEVAGISRSNFAQLFRSVMGTTVGDYICGCRLDLAQLLLRSGEPLKRVADRVGYGSAESMARVFVERLQLSPRAWLLADRAKKLDAPPVANDPGLVVALREAATALPESKSSGQAQGPVRGRSHGSVD